ncbi:hypothetical protein BYT27DRAFT_7227464 [Phlegmacium glaucopus]|nr:hypothetical protein BYT27DRAFT_7227464 [Phlegmacium glaucopus]
MSNNSPTGTNGYGPKNYPDDETLKVALHQYAKERFSTEQCLARLEAEHNFTIKFIIHTLDFIWGILATYAPEGLAHHFPGVNHIQHSKLTSIGPNHQHHADGHEKLNAQALNIGGMGLNIYRIKDQWSSFILHLIVKHKLIPITFITDKGSSTGIIYASQTAYTAELDTNQFPPMLQIQSVHNTPIEGLWHWFLQTFGVNIKDTIHGGFQAGIYKTTSNMSGSTPRHGFTVPAPPVEDLIDALHGQISHAARSAYDAVGRPSLDNLLLGWEVFSSMVCVINVASSLT